MQLLIPQGNQLHVLANICGHHWADYENKEEKFMAA